jgi:hypothetical protein
MKMNSLFKKRQFSNLPDFGWQMKTLDTAQTRFDIDENNVFHLHIEHDIIQNVTPKMLLWWFQNIGGDMVCQGKKYPKYLVWHPKDHIHWALVKTAPDGSVGVGSQFRIVEAFGRNTHFLVDSIEIVEKLDCTGIKLVKRILGVEVFSLQHDFIPVPNGTQYNSYMKVGVSKGLFGWVFNTIIRPFIFSKPMGEAWLKHNIEEVGNFEFFLPELYHNRVFKKIGV